MIENKKEACKHNFMNFFLTYGVILSYIKQDYWSKSLDLINYIDELYLQPSREDIILGMNNIKLNFENIIEVVEKDQDLQQDNNLKIEDNTLQEVDEEITIK